MKVKRSFSLKCIHEGEVKRVQADTENLCGFFPYIFQQNLYLVLYIVNNNALMENVNQKFYLQAPSPGLAGNFALTC